MMSFDEWMNQPSICDSCSCEIPQGQEDVIDSRDEGGTFALCHDCGRLVDAKFKAMNAARHSPSVRTARVAAMRWLRISLGIARGEFPDGGECKRVQWAGVAHAAERFLALKATQ